MDFRFADRINKKYKHIKITIITLSDEQMRKIIVLSFVTLDGVIQAPGGPKEDTSGGFKYGGWSFGYWDEAIGKIMGKQIKPPYDLLLGRKTYEIFAPYWSKQKHEPADAFNKAKKYVVSTTLKELDWKPSELISSNVVEQIKKLKKQKGPNLQVHGSANLVQTLLKNDLVDELWLKIYPITIGTGKRLFGDGTIPAEFKLKDCKTSTKGVIAATYVRAGDIKTGSF